MPCDQLLRRATISLGEVRLRCYAWNPYAGARHPPLTYYAWIRLVCLPYECWLSRTVAALVGGFGRFIRADDFTSRMVDLSGYRCLIAVNHLSDIPENLDLSFGDLSLSILIQLERWGRRDATTQRLPPNEGTDQHDPHEAPPLVNAHRRSTGSARGRHSLTGGSSNSNASWNSSEFATEDACWTDLISPRRMLLPWPA